MEKHTTGSNVGTLLLAMLVAAQVAGAEHRLTEHDTHILTLDATELYAGLEARRLRLFEDGLAMDPRNLSSPPTPAQLITDVLDLGGPAVLSEPVDITRVAAVVESNATAQDRLEVQMRSGSTFFQHADTWCDWNTTQSQRPRGRYAQFRVIVLSERPEFRIQGLQVETVHAEPGPPYKTELTLIDQRIQQMVASPIPFAYQRPDHADLLWLRDTFPLNQVIATGKTEMEQVNALCTWVSSRKNDRHRGWNTLGYYPWNVRRLISDSEDGVIHGHCASYCSVFLACCHAFGWQGRHLAVEGYRENCHEIAEIYINELGRWIYFDPSLATYYIDRATGRPLDTLEMHNFYLATHFGQPGDTVPALETDFQRLDRRRASIDWSTFPGQPVSDDWIYGRKGEWNWTKAQGILTTAWLQMTPRNNFYDQPQPVFQQFGGGPTGTNDFPVWVDARTPPRTKTTINFYTRRRDFYWTLNQASLRMVRTGAQTLAVEFGNSQPFFQRYHVTYNGETVIYDKPQFVWHLQSGENRLRVECEDAFGNCGVASEVVLQLKR